MSANYYVGILHRVRPGSSRLEYTATTLEGNAMSVSEPAYEQLVKEQTGPWFSGHGAYQRARMLAHLLCDDARALMPDLEIEDLCNLVPDKVPA